MDKIKVDDFIRDHPGLAFPEYRALSEEETASVRKRIADSLALSAGVTPLELVKTISDRSVALPQTNAEDASFDFLTLLRASKIMPGEKALVNWYRLDEIDEMNMSDFSRYFADLWYPAADHIDVFDHTISWIVSIDYSGTVNLLRLNP